MPARGLMPPAYLWYSNEIEEYLILKMDYNDVSLTLGVWVDSEKHYPARWQRSVVLWDSSCILLDIMMFSVWPGAGKLVWSILSDWFLIFNHKVWSYLCLCTSCNVHRLGHTCKMISKIQLFTPSVMDCLSPAKDFDYNFIYICFSNWFYSCFVCLDILQCVNFYFSGT